MLQVARDLFLASARRLRLGSTPGGHRVGNLEACRQGWAAVNRTGVDIAAAADAIVIVGPDGGAKWRPCAAHTIAETDLPRLGVEHEYLHSVVLHGWRSGRLPGIRHGHFGAGAAQVIDNLPYIGLTLRRHH